MREIIQKLQRALSQAQTFAKQTPPEALARTRLVAREAQAALASMDAKAVAHEREQLTSILAMANLRIGQYEAVVAGWDHSVRERAELFHTHEVERLQRPIASKI